jgi:NHL repeat-containing protein
VAASATGALALSGIDTISTIAGTDTPGFSGDGGPATAARLGVPTGVAVDRQGNVYIADRENHRVRRVSGGTFTTIAGTGTQGFSGDGGTATAAQLSFPSGVAVDGQGNVYIADAGNDRVRRVSGGTITTFAGTGTKGFSGDGRYWARTSDPQLVELVLSQLS